MILSYEKRRVINYKEFKYFNNESFRFAVK